MGSTRNSGENGVPEANLPMPVHPVVNIADARPEKAETPQRATRATVWLHRLSLVIFVVFCIELGMLLAVLPWTPVWIHNGLLTSNATLKAILQENFVRGVITGLGLVDIWIGIWEAVHYSDPV
jgi:hypothetical protein